LQNDALGEGPLQKYFLGETMVRHPIVPLLRTKSSLQHGAGVDIFTANMYLAEDLMRNKKEMGSKHFFLIAFPPFDLMLGTGVEAWRVVGTALCQVDVCRHRYSGSGGVVCHTLGVRMLADVTCFQVPELASQR
jgi:hypothetical protein